MYTGEIAEGMVVHSCKGKGSRESKGKLGSVNLMVLRRKL